MEYEKVIDEAFIVPGFFKSRHAVDEDAGVREDEHFTSTNSFPGEDHTSAHSLTFIDLLIAVFVDPREERGGHQGFASRQCGRMVEKEGIDTFEERVFGTALCKDKGRVLVLSIDAGEILPANTDRGVQLRQQQVACKGFVCEKDRVPPGQVPL